MTIVKLEPFQENWHHFFKTEKELLLSFLSPLSIDFHHVGSTSIPGCIAKPIIDILGVIHDPLQLDSYKELFEKHGYFVYGEYGIKGRSYYSKKSNPPIHLHIFERGHPEAERMLRFRDYLKKNHEFIEEYNFIKRKLATEFQRKEYTKRKDPFIKKITMLAALEASSLYYPINKEKKSRQWTESRLIDSMEANWHLHLTYFSKYVPIYELIYESDATIVRTLIEDDTYNYIACAQFNAENVSERIKNCASYFEIFKLPFSWWIGPKNSPENLEEMLLQEEFEPKEINVGMHYTINNPVNNSKASDSPLVNIERILKKDALKEFTEIVISIGMHPQIYEKIYSQIPEILYCDGAPYEFYIGKVNGTPVVTGILIFNAHVAGIYYITTHPDHRKKGYATAMMNSLIARAYEMGFEKCILQASREGRFVYEKMGFNPFCTFKEYKKIKF